MRYEPEASSESNLSPLIRFKDFVYIACPHSEYVSVINNYLEGEQEVVGWGMLDER